MSMNQPHPTPVRLPTDLKAWVQASAKANRRSVNAEILMLLDLARKQMEVPATTS